MTKAGFFKKKDFVYDEMLGGYICPNDQVLKYSTTTKNGYREFKSDKTNVLHAHFYQNVQIVKTIQK